jgi:cyanophycinase-like exopeptidase
VGFGVDERTALVVHSGRRLEVLGSSEVRVILSATDREPLTVRTLTATSPQLEGGPVPAAGNPPGYQGDLLALVREAQARVRLSPPR